MLTSFPPELPPVIDSAPFIVIGSGIAGLYTALELSKLGQVILLTKSIPSESNTNYAQGGIAAAIGLHDSPELHYQDTIMAGAGLCNSKAVLTLVYDGPARVRHLIDLGVPFQQTQGEISLTREAAHSRRRILHANGDATGRAVSDTLLERVKENPAITVKDGHFVLALITSKGYCSGVVTIFENELQTFLSPSVILASGGLGQLYGKTTNPAIATGDGLALAYNCHATLRDMEFLQFHPTALYLPPAPSFLISETVRGEGALLLNSEGRRFMPDYHPQAELAPRDVVARAIFNEIQKSGQPYVLLDLSKIATADIKTRFPNIYRTCLHYGLDITCRPIPVAPAAHYMMGGVVTDLNGRTNIPNLFAAGEAACTGVHGANRLASNSLLEGLVFGGRIAAYLKEHPQPVVSKGNYKIHYPQLLTDYQNRDRDHRALHQLTNDYLGIMRDATGLNKALEKLEAISAQDRVFELNPNYFELQNMYLLAKLMFSAALKRTESRGGHFRSDFPAPARKWRKHISFRKLKIGVKR